MIKIECNNMTTSQAVSIVDKILEQYGNAIEGQPYMNMDGNIGAIKYSLTKSKAGNIFCKVWRDA